MTNFKHSLTGLALSIITNCAASLDLPDEPLFLQTGANANVLFNMSIETPMGGGAYNDASGSIPGCTGRITVEGSDDVGTCYFPDSVYIGYFDPLKCYDYQGSTSGFTPVSAANATTHSCSGNWSGNFLNWASMTAIDTYIMTMTGGRRIEDTSTKTIIERSLAFVESYAYHTKAIGSSVDNSSGSGVSLNSVTPYSDSWAKIVQNQNSSSFVLQKPSGNVTIAVKVEVCKRNTSLANNGLEDNCISYNDGNSTYYKPEGLTQENAKRMKFGVMAYTTDDNKNRQGGVLRSNMKYVGPEEGDGSINTIKEYTENGLMLSNPDSASSGNSGVINYINKFAVEAGKYKEFDPVSELFYEGIRFFKGLTPTPETYSGLSTANNGGFPIITSWQNPIQYECQKNFMIGINDAYPWFDKKIPGTHFSSSSITDGLGRAVDVSAESDYGEPGGASSFTDQTTGSAINTKTETNTIGALEDTETSGALSTKLGTNKLGEMLAPNTGDDLTPLPPTTNRMNSYYVAGLAYYANTNDLSPLDGKQTLTTFMIDSQEYNPNPLVGHVNPLWLAGKYGGFKDTNDDQTPQASEWDVDSDGEPDNYVLATEPSKMVAKLQESFDAIALLDTASSSSVALNSTVLKTTSQLFQAEFDSAGWSGKLSAYALNPTNADLILPASWEASNNFPAHGARDIFTMVDISGTMTPVEFTSTDVTLTGGTSSELIDYIRGDQSNEVSAGGSYRDRSSLLGDIINSSPVSVGVSNAFYHVLPSTEGTSYSSFLISKINRFTNSGTETPFSYVYAGANDGMLHAFDSRTGVEEFAYIPSSLHDDLHKLTDPNYTHKYYVDGKFVAADAYINSNWKTMLVGPLGYGGRAIFALDITAPDSFDENKVMWEFTKDSDTANGSNEMGYVLHQPQLIRLDNGKWVVIFGNGFNSDSQKAQLIILDAEDGSILKIIDTEAGSSSHPNGLSKPFLLDADGDASVETAYAGDLLGNIWKFDLAGAVSSWSVSFSSAGNPAPLYTAVDSLGVAQAITTQPVLANHPDGGYSVLFGTGKYFASGDNIIPTTPQVQSFYGVRDDLSSSPLSTGRSNLQKQELLYQGAASGETVRIVSNNSVANSKDGFYLDMLMPTASSSVKEGERIIANPQVRFGRIIFLTLIPSANPCDSGGRSFLMELSATTGARLESSVLDINSDGYINASDNVTVDGDSVPVSGKEIDGTLSGLSIIETNDDKEFKITSRIMGGTSKTAESKPSISGRQSWRQLQ